VESWFEEVQAWNLKVSEGLDLSEDMAVVLGALMVLETQQEVVAAAVVLRRKMVLPLDDEVVGSPVGKKAAVDTVALSKSFSSCW
jgi:hypothetical protein